jgi:hypothetical protein
MERGVMTDNRKRWREAQREIEATLAAHPYRREADELINLVFEGNFNSNKRALAVADWLREFVAAREYGCTGLALDLAPRAPESDALASGAEVLAGASDAEVDGFLEAVREARGAVPREPGSPRAEEVIRRLRDSDGLELGPE